MKKITIIMPEEDAIFLLALIKESEENGHIGDNGFSVKVEEEGTNNGN